MCLFGMSYAPKSSSSHGLSASEALGSQQAGQLRGELEALEEQLRQVFSQRQAMEQALERLKGPSAKIRAWQQDQVRRRC